MLVDTHKENVVDEVINQKASWKWWVLVGTCLAGVMVALDFTIVNTSLNNIQESLLSDHAAVAMVYCWLWSDVL